MTKQYLVFTDLDSTLLDHDDYGYEPVRPLVRELEQGGIPLIFNSSKTQVESLHLREELDNRHPFIFENGGGLAIPEAYFDHIMPELAPEAGYLLQLFGADYGSIRRILLDLREEKGYPFRGLGDMDEAEIGRHTRLSGAAAERAWLRRSSEPLIWQGDPERLHAFSHDLREHGLKLVRGGRFLHVMGRTDKGRAMKWLLAQYRQRFQKPLHVIALGDSDNDRPMLELAETAIVIPHRDGSHLEMEHPDLITADTPAPRGWVRGLAQVLRRIGKGDIVHE